MSENRVWEPKYRNVIRWARQDLNFAGLLDRTQSRSVWALNEAGMRVVSDNDDDTALVQAIYRLQPRGQDSSESEAERPEPSEEPGGEVQAPDEAVLHALGVYERYIRDELRQELVNVSPTRFEHIAADVLAASLDAAKKVVTRPSRDGGIDGVLWLDHLGLTKAVFQAKRYPSSNVGRTDIDAFYAAARRENAAAMVFVTTGGFSPEAVQAASSFGIRLIDGDALVALMLEVGVGVREQRRLALFGVDSSYFAEDE